jgi:hypothetical protein
MANRKSNHATLSEEFQSPIEKQIMPHGALIVFLLDFGTVPTVWHYWFFYWSLELFRQCGIIGFSIELWNCSNHVALFEITLQCRNISKVQYKNQ